MKEYYLIEEDKKIVNVPIVKDWMKKINPKYLIWGSYHLIPDISTLYVKNEDFIYWGNILFSPFFMMDKSIFDITKLYEPNMGHREVAIINYEKNDMHQYFIPHLKVVDCLSNESIFNTDHSILEKIVLDEKKLEDKEIFQLGSVKNRYVVVSLQILESFLRRGAIISYRELLVK